VVSISLVYHDEPSPPSFFTFIDDPLYYDLQSSLLQISVHLLFCSMETFVVIYVFLAFKPIWGSHREGTKNIACVCDDDAMSIKVELIREWNGRGYNGDDSRFGKSSFSLFLLLFFLLRRFFFFWSFGNVVWERGFNLGVFTHVHLREREREGGRRSAGVCVCVLVGKMPYGPS